MYKEVSVILLFIGNDGLTPFNFFFSNLYILHSKTDIPFVFPKGLATHSYVSSCFAAVSLSHLAFKVKFYFLSIDQEWLYFQGKLNDFSKMLHFTPWNQRGKKESIGHYKESMEILRAIY